MSNNLLLDILDTAYHTTLQVYVPNIHRNSKISRQRANISFGNWIRPHGVKRHFHHNSIATNNAIPHGAREVGELPISPCSGTVQFHRFSTQWYFIKLSILVTSSYIPKTQNLWGNEGHGWLLQNNMKLQPYDDRVIPLWSMGTNRIWRSCKQYNVFFQPQTIDVIIYFSLILFN